MRRIVVDSAIVLDWFTGVQGPAQVLREEYEQGALGIVAPRSLCGEILEAVARTPGWTADRLASLAAELERLGFETRDPPASELAAWLSRGLSGPAAAYAALASALDVPLVTADEELLCKAATVTQRP